MTCFNMIDTIFLPSLFQTIQWVSTFREQLYPVITCDSTKPGDIFKNLESSQIKILPELNNAVTELDSRIKNIEGFGLKGTADFNNSNK